MTLSIIGIVLGVIAIGLIFWFRKEQKGHNEWLYGETEAAEHRYNALMKDFTDYQVRCDRELSKLEKELEIQSKNHSTRMDKMNKSLPSIIGQVVGQIEFAQDIINRKK